MLPNPVERFYGPARFGPNTQFILEDVLAEQAAQEIQQQQPATGRARQRGRSTRVSSKKGSPDS